MCYCFPNFQRSFQLTAAPFLIGSAKVGAFNYLPNLFSGFFLPPKADFVSKNFAFFKAGCKYRTAYSFTPNFYTLQLCTLAEIAPGSAFQPKKKSRPLIRQTPFSPALYVISYPIFPAEKTIPGC